MTPDLPPSHNLGKVFLRTRKVCHSRSHEHACIILLYSHTMSREYAFYLGELVVATVESDVLGLDTIRHVDCDLVLPLSNSCERCSTCSTHRSTLRAMLSKQHHTSGSSSDRAAPESSVNFRYTNIND